MTKPQAPIFQRRPDLAAAAEAAEAQRKEKIRIRRENLAATPSADLPAQAEPVIKPLVTPLCVFAAGRSDFDCVVRGPFSGSEALAVIFSRLPMEEYGWEYRHTDINRAGHADAFPVWRVSKRRSFIADPVAQPQQEAAAPRPKSGNGAVSNFAGGGR